MKTSTVTSFSGEYAFLSNFFSRPLLFHSVDYKTAEHAFQALKTTNPDEFWPIVNAKTPGQAKRLGRRCKLRADWEQVKLTMMRDVLCVKFSDGDLGQRLLRTGDAHLEEGNSWGDRFWGTVNGTGENHLGKLLMEIRRELRSDRIGLQARDLPEDRQLQLQRFLACLSSNHQDPLSCK
jgi:N-glycosidase YbiA